ncbi:Synaptotagmin-like protein 2 [Triplophysa tibetana]|uniref:Synaptotagmin-like protein 1 n=1 Tax=Triplophysa tibetana TaxID=1572043 RepID=A0A5A9NPH0_9TELE|nr:Synaptotagmin-like protein 2 [Triplophysa tibetana]
MKQSKSASEFIDLSFLSAEEEAAIRQVLLRNEDLTRLETGRVRKLRQSVPDLTRLKTLSGEWFEEIRSERYGQRTDVTAVVRSSMRWKKTAGLAGKSSPENVEISNGHKPTFNTDPRNGSTQEDLKAENVHRPALNGTEPENKTTQPKDFSSDRTSSNVQLSSEVPMQPETKSERSATKDAANAEPRRKISLPPALRKDQSFEENWVKISLEPNPIKPVHDESAGLKLKEVNTDDESTETLMKQDVLDQKKPDRNFGESLSLNFPDQTAIQIVSEKRPPSKPARISRDVSLERCSSSPAENNNKPNIKSGSDQGSKEVTESANASTGGNQQNSITLLFRESETDKPAFSNFANEREAKVVSRDDEASLDRMESELKNVSTGTLAKTDTDAFEREAGEEQINEQPSVERPSLGQLKGGIKMRSHEISSEPLQEYNKPVEMAKKSSNIQIDLLLRNQKTEVVEPRASDITVKRDPKMNVEKEKRKPSGELNLPKDTRSPSHVLTELSKERLCMTDDGKLEHSGDTLHFSMKDNEKPRHEEEEKIKTKPSNELKRPVDTHISQSDVITDLSKDHLAMTDDGKVVQGEDVIFEETSFKTTPQAKGYKSSRDGDVVTEQGRGSSDRKAVVGERDTDQKTESNILLSVLARAQKARPPVLHITSVEELKQEERDDKIPTIVIMPSESPESKRMEGNKNEALVLEASSGGFKTPSYTTDFWEDEGVNSDDDSSLSSYGSDLSSRKGRSASALSLTDRTGSLLSVYSEAGDFGNVQVQGSVEFALMYSPVGELIIMIEQCQDLAIASTRKQRTDPYVKTYLYPDKSRRGKKKTSIKKRTVNPVYVESLRYKVTRQELPGKTLNLSVWHNDSRGRNVFLGQVEINFKTWNWAHEALTWYNLQAKNSENPETQESHGSLSVSLKYVSPDPTGGSKNSSGEIHVWLREAKELRRLKPQGVDSFVKCYILPDTRKKSRQKTRVIKKTQDPVYNHTMVYDGFQTGELMEACCELTVWDHNTLSNQFLGGARLSLGTGQSYGKKVEWMDSTNEEVEIWKRMLANPNSWVDGDVPLRSSMTSK